MKKILLTSMILTVSIFAFDNNTTLISKPIKNRWQRFLPGQSESSSMDINAVRDMAGNRYALEEDSNLSLEYRDIKAVRDRYGNRYALEADSDSSLKYVYIKLIDDESNVSLAKYYLYLYEKDGLYTLESDEENIDEKDQVIEVSISE